MLNRHRAAAEAIAALGLPDVRVLDVGSRDGALGVALRARVPGARVVTLDRAPPADLVAALPHLPVAPRGFDVVAALDVLEHCDDLAAAFAACLDAADKLFVCSMPNMAHPVFRARFALTGRLSDKYDLKNARQADRHRWVTPLAQADALVAQLAAAHGARLEVTHLTEGRRAAVLAALLRPLGAPPQLWAWTSLYRIAR